jgi:hypothetical protein
MEFNAKGFFEQGREQAKAFNGIRDEGVLAGAGQGRLRDRKRGKQTQNVFNISTSE